MLLSEKTKQLLNLLHADAFVHQEALVSQLEYRNLPASRQNIGKHIDQLEKGCFIRYGIIENPNVHDVRTFFIEIKTNPEEPEIVSRINAIPQVRSIDGIIGQNSLVVKVCTRNDHQFTDILKKVDDIITGTRFQHYKIINCLKTFKDGGKSLVLADGTETSEKIPEFDSIDELLLDTMQNTTPREGAIPERMSYTWIHERASPHHPAVTYDQVRRRVDAMIEARLIDTFTIKLSPSLIPQTDFPLKFYLQVLPKRLSEYDAIAAQTLAPREEIAELYRTGEEYGLYAVARTGSIAEYREFLESLYLTGKVQDTVSTLVIDEKLPAIFKPFKDRQQAIA
ncbi:MAG: Lrp/AsnC family transcriptional regulator [Candidatus Lokiarchaeota archaeon]|nr:Lrp/AsnC family transcriptional regulator [Candidatus Lokiarchaeota archaeon]